MSDTNTTIYTPQPNTQFLNPNGTVSREWLYYLLGLLTRTGGTPGINVATLQQEIVNLSVASALSGPETPPVYPLSVAAVMDGIPAPRPAAIRAIDLFEAPPPRVMPNPIIVSLMVL